MKRSIYIMALVVIVSCTPTMSETQKAKPTGFYRLENPDIERGKKLADVMLCSMCHSPVTLEGGLQLHNEKLRLAGGIKIVSPPDGTFYTKNITPDIETGIGGWNFDEIARAITQGIRKNGNGMGVMPTHYYGNITNDDLNALIAYLQSNSPVYHKLPANSKMHLKDKIAAGLRLLVPFVDYPGQDWYFGDHGTFAKSTLSNENDFDLDVQSLPPLIVDPSKTTPEIELGKYLVTISACAFCHTPVGITGQTMDLALSGGLKVIGPVCGTVYSKNLTPDQETGLGNWSDKEIATAIRSGVTKEGKQLCPTIMPWQAYAMYSDDEVGAIIAYLKAIPPKSRKIPETIPPTGNEPPFQTFRMGDSAE